MVRTRARARTQAQAQAQAQARARTRRGRGREHGRRRGRGHTRRRRNERRWRCRHVLHRWELPRLEQRRGRRRRRVGRRHVPRPTRERHHVRAAPILPHQRRQGGRLRLALEGRVDDGEIDQLARRRAFERCAHELELGHQKCLRGGLARARWNAVDVLAVGQGHRLRRLLLALEHDLRGHIGRDIGAQCGGCGPRGRRCAERHRCDGHDWRSGGHGRRRDRGRWRVNSHGGLDNGRGRRAHHHRLGSNRRPSRGRLPVGTGPRGDRRRRWGRRGSCRGRGRYCRWRCRSHGRSLVRRAPHLVSHARVGVDRAAAVVEQLDRKAAHRAGVAALAPRELEGLLPRLGVEVQRLLLSRCKRRHLDEPAHESLRLPGIRVTRAVARELLSGAHRHGQTPHSARRPSAGRSLAA